MWRWVTRGLVLSFLAILVAPAAHAQDAVGALDFPEPAPTVSTGMVLVKGWVIDPGLVSHVDLYVDEQFQHQVNINIPRPDLSEILKSYPGHETTAPGIQTGFLASRFSTGAHSVYIKVFSSDGHVTEIGRRTILIDSTLPQNPFGYLDIPGGGGTIDANGAFPVIGWAADTDGIDRVNILIDNLVLQSAVYGGERADVGNAFPDFPAAAFSGFVANIDTTRIQDGVHQLSVMAYDRKGGSKLIGRRIVQVFNSELNLKPFGSVDEPQRDAVLYGTNCSTLPPRIVSPPVTPGSHITAVRGWALDLGTRLDTGRVGYVEMMIDGVRWASTDDCGYSTIFNAYTNCYGLPRYDVQRFYPNFPDAPRSGYMFTLDVGALIALGVRPGAHTLKIRVGDEFGTFTEMPGPQGIPVFFNCAQNNQDFASLGFIERPINFDQLRGVVNFQGWALDQNNGVNQVEILVDGNYRGNALYGITRTDVQQAYPFIFNSIHSGWNFQTDTKLLSDGRHRLTVRVLDGIGIRSEIGSVDFYVDNTH